MNVPAEPFDNADDSAEPGESADEARARLVAAYFDGAQAALERKAFEQRMLDDADAAGEFETEALAHRALGELATHAALPSDFAAGVLAAIDRAELATSAEDQRAETIGDAAMRQFARLAALPANFARRVLARLPATTTSTTAAGSGAVGNTGDGEVPSVINLEGARRKQQASRRRARLHTIRSLIAAAAVILLVVGTSFRVAQIYIDSESTGIADGSNNPNGTGPVDGTPPVAPQDFTPTYRLVAGTVDEEPVDGDGPLRVRATGGQPAVIETNTRATDGGTVPVSVVLRDGAVAELGERLNIVSGEACVSPAAPLRGAAGEDKLIASVGAGRHRVVEVGNGPVTITVRLTEGTNLPVVDVEVYGGIALLVEGFGLPGTGSQTEPISLTVGRRARHGSWVGSDTSPDANAPIRLMFESLQSRLLPAWAALARGWTLAARLRQQAQHEGIDPLDPETWQDALTHVGALPPAAEVMDALRERVLSRRMSPEEVDRLAEFLGGAIDQGASMDAVLRELLGAYLRVLESPTQESWQELLERLRDILEDAARQGAFDWPRNGENGENGDWEGWQWQIPRDGEHRWQPGEDWPWNRDSDDDAQDADTPWRPSHDRWIQNADEGEDADD